MVRKAAIVVALFAVAGLGFAGSGQWVGSGPFGGTVTSIVTFPDQPLKVLAGTAHGPYVSEDAGSSWRRTGRIDIEVDNLVVAPSDPLIVYGSGWAFRNGEWASVLLHSTDGGTTWVERPTPAAPGSAGNYALLALAVHPQQPAVIVAGVGGGVLRSTDSGVTWEYVDGDGRVMAVAFDPAQPDTVFAGVVDRGVESPWGGVIKSTDGGRTFSASRDGLLRAYYAERPQWAPVVGLAFVPGTPGSMLAMTGEYNAFNYEEVVQSTDGGAHWTSILRFPSSSSANGFSPLSLAFDPTDPQTILVGSFSYGLRRSTDGGATWEEASGGLRCAGASDNPYDPDVKPVQEVYTVALLPGNGPRALIGTDREGVWLSDDLGGSWRQSNQGLAAMTVNTLLAEGATPGTLLAGTAEAAVVRSDDGGRTWTPANSGLYDGCAQYRGGSPAPVCAPSNVQRLVRLPGAGGLGAGDCGYFTSSDGGRTWSQTQGGSRFLDVAVDPRDPRVVVAGFNTGYYEAEIRRSVDGGQTWTPCGKPPDVEHWTYINDLLVDPTSSLRVYAATGSGVYMSVDSCASWSRRSHGLPPACPSVGDVVMQSTPPYRMLAATTCGLFMSSGGGASWSPVGPAGEAISDLIADPGFPSVFYAGTATQGVLQSADGGLTWTSLGRGLPSGVASLLFSPSERQLIAGTAGGSVWFLDLPTSPRRVLRRSGAGAPPSTAATVEETPLD
ncbi:MAG: WD40/YVTN/BNR-like repeat-containing protein [Thermoanaerobaculaceae bacterium]